MSERTDRMIRVFHDALPNGSQHVVDDIGEYLAPALDAAFNCELDRLRTLLRAFAESDPLRRNGFAQEWECIHCNQARFTHDDACPWRMARKELGL